MKAGLHGQTNFHNLIQAAEMLFQPPEHCQNRSLCESLAALRTDAERYCMQLQDCTAESATQDASPVCSLEATWGKCPLFYAQQLLKAAVESERAWLTGRGCKFENTSTAPTAEAEGDIHGRQAQESAAETAAGDMENRMGLQGGANGSAAQGAAPDQALHSSHGMSQQDDIMCAQQRLSLSVTSDSDIDIGGTPPPLPPPVVRLDWARPGTRTGAAAAQQAHLTSQHGMAGPHTVQEQMALVPDTYADQDDAQCVPRLASCEVAKAPGSDSSPELEDIENSSLHSNRGMRLSGSPNKPSSEETKHAQHGGDSREPAGQVGTPHEGTPYSSPVGIIQSQQEQPAAGHERSAPAENSSDPPDTPYSSPAEVPLGQEAPDQAPRGPPSAAGAPEADLSEDDLFEDAAQTLPDASTQATARPGFAQTPESAGHGEGLHPLQQPSEGAAAQGTAAATSPGATQHDVNILVSLFNSFAYCYLTNRRGDAPSTQTSLHSWHVG